MKKQDKRNLHKKSVDQLQKELHELTVQLTKFGLEARIKQQKNTRTGRFLRDDIARVKTVLHLMLMKKKEQSV